MLNCIGGQIYLYEGQRYLLVFNFAIVFMPKKNQRLKLRHFHGFEKKHEFMVLARIMKIKPLRK
jgi:hypothetical protein